MKRILISIATCLVIFIASLTIASEAYASGFSPANVRSAYFTTAATAGMPEVLKKIKSDVVPQLTEILTPQQLEMFESGISSGSSFRKTFKSLMLTSEQKHEIKAVLATVPRRDAFAALTPMEKKELFLKKKEAFMPSSEEIIDRINTGKGEGGTVSKEVQDKIEQGIKARDTYMPSSESIVDKIKAGVKGAIDSVEDGLDQ
ncbi:MAG: hypothetical protein WA885_15960 [Phormidesmis sp.]